MLSSSRGLRVEAQNGLPEPRWFDRASPRVADPLFEQRVLRAAAN